MITAVRTQIFGSLMARSQCTGPGLETMGYHVLCRTVHTAQGPEMGPDPIVSYCVSPVPYTCPIPVSVQCERAIRPGLDFSVLTDYTIFHHL